MTREFFYRFGKTFYKIDSFYAKFAKKSGVKPNLLWILYALDDGNSHSQKEISQSWDIPITTVNTIVLELQKDNYIEFVHIPGKKREMNIILTESGKEYSKKLLKGIYQIEDNVYKSLKEKERVVDDLEYLLEQLNCYMEE